jgi:hypothetical protein
MNYDGLTCNITGMMGIVEGIIPKAGPTFQRFQVSEL